MDQSIQMFYTLDMAESLSIENVLSLSVDERIKLIETIWDSIAACPDDLKLTSKQQAELERRLLAYEKDPTAGSPWETVRRRIEQG